MLGQWEEAAKDLHLASKLDYDEEISAVLKKVSFFHFCFLFFILFLFLFFRNLNYCFYDR